MATNRNRTLRLNSLLKEVISEVIHRDVRNPHVHPLVSVAAVDISKDLQHAKVYISILGTQADKEATIKALQSAAGFISVHASKKVVMRYFPKLLFILDDTVDKLMRVDTLISKNSKERDTRISNV